MPLTEHYQINMLITLTKSVLLEQLKSDTLSSPKSTIFKSEQPVCLISEVCHLITSLHSGMVALDCDKSIRAVNLVQLQ
jgi:hypothetical protein